MLSNLVKIKETFEKELAAVKDGAALESLRIKYLGRKSGMMNDVMQKIREVPPEQKSQYGSEANKLKGYITSKIDEAEQGLGGAQKKSADFFDVTLPGIPPVRGGYHPLELTRRMIEGIFQRLGYTIVEGPEAETDWHNFEALNFPKHHPARDMQDTFFLENDLVLRTHTSPVQIRTMEKTKPPVRIICPGRTFRCDWDITHTPNFYQVEGLMVDAGVSFADLKGTIDHFCRELFSPDTVTRFRPSYFPFVEPGAEVDIRCVKCGGKGCRVCKQTGWLEIMGAGMVHVNVLENVGYDSEIYTGFAFGMGIDRIAMLKFGIDDTRLHYENNLRYLEQFRGVC
ncbi:MAG: phenylalanine--tRNA ligase subunit alpha [Acidobacteria bacterium]|nr:phenylalanine--tRNA ligase subunit alpha [Acidobacteriota bacterium]